jgi:hypothetical protein
LHPPCPACSGTGFLPGSDTVTTELKLLVDWNPKIYKAVDDVLRLPFDLALVKGFLADEPKVLQARYIILDYANAIYTNNRYIILSQPVNRANILVNKYFEFYLQRTGA